MRKIYLFLIRIQFQRTQQIWEMSKMHSDDRESGGVFAHYLLEMQHAFSFTESLMGQSSSEYFLLHMRQHAQEDTRMQARMHTSCKFKNDDGSMH